MSCSRTQHGGGRSRTPDLSLRSPTLYHWATALPPSTAINWSKCILMVSVHIWRSIYTNNAILCIIWKFDLSSRGVLGRIYALSIEVLCELVFMASHDYFTHFIPSQSLGGAKNGRSLRKTTWPSASRTWLVSSDPNEARTHSSEMTKRFRSLMISGLNHSATGAAFTASLTVKRFYCPVNTIKVMSSQSLNLSTVPGYAS